MNYQNTIAYLAPEGLEDSLESELQNVQARYGRLFLVKGQTQKSYWQQNIWYNPVLIPIASIQDAAKKLGFSAKQTMMFAQQL